MIPCGIPYIFGTTKESGKNVLPDAPLKNAGVEVIIGEIESIDCNERQCKSESGELISFDKLIIACGSTPYTPGWLEGSQLDNVFVIPKNKVYLDQFKKKIENLEEIVVVGAGFIGVELADELVKGNKKVTLIEKMPQVLPAAFDSEIAEDAESKLIERGIQVMKGVGVKKLDGQNSVEKIILDNGAEIKADAVVLSMGYRPNTELAEKCHLKINDLGFIQVDEYMRTGVPGVFAIGDCAEKRDFFTRKLSSTMLASTACAEARIAAMNLYSLSILKTFSGTIAIYSTAIGETSYSTAGLTESQASSEGYQIATGIFEGVDKHPGCLPNAHKQKVKVIASKECGTVLGVEIIGGISGGELINVAGLAIQNKMTLASLLSTQIGTHPLLTGSPAGYPLIKAVEAAWKNCK